MYKSVQVLCALCCSCSRESKKKSIKEKKGIMWSCSLRFHHPTTGTPPVETFMCLFEAQSSVYGLHIIKQPLEDTVRHHKGACVYFSSQVIDLNASCRRDNLHGCTNIWILPKATSGICTICQPPSHPHTHQVCGELLSPSPPIRNDKSGHQGMEWRYPSLYSSIKNYCTSTVLQAEVAAFYSELHPSQRHQLPT